MNDCKSKDKISIGNLGNTVRKIGVPPNTGWPYSMIEDSNMDLSIQGFKNWYGISVAEIMINLRKLLLIIVGFFDKDDKTIFTSDMFQIIFSNVIFTLIPLLLPILLPVIFIIFLVMSSFAAWKNDEHPFHLFFLAIFFCGPAAFLSGGVMATSFIQFLFTFLLLPLFLNQSKLKKIALCNADLFTYLFGALCVSSTMTHLDDKYGYCALILYIIALLRRLYKLYR